MGTGDPEPNALPPQSLGALGPETLQLEEVIPQTPVFMDLGEHVGISYM